MKELGLQDLLRYGLSGGVGLGALLLMYPKTACVIGTIDGAGKMTLILGSILVFGTLIYNIHRALLFPVLFRAISLFTLPLGTRFTWKLLVPWLPSNSEIDIDRWRWGLDDKHRNRWNEWGAQTHFLYCAAWATLAAFVSGRYMTGSTTCRARHIFWTLFSITLIAGMVNNFRLLYSMTTEKHG